MLARAEGILSALASDRPDDATAPTLLAECALVRAAFLKRAGRGHVEAARRGIERLDQAMALQPRNPSPWVIRARLQALADEPERARENLARAVSMNPLVRGGAEAVLTRAELGAR